MRSIAELNFSLARASWGTKVSKGQDSKVWSVIEFKCLAPRVTLIVSPLGTKMSGYKKIVPLIDLSVGGETNLSDNFVCF